MNDYKEEEKDRLVRLFDHYQCTRCADSYNVFLSAISRTFIEISYFTGAYDGPASRLMLAVERGCVNRSLVAFCGAGVLAPATPAGRFWHSDGDTALAHRVAWFLVRE